MVELRKGKKLGTLGRLPDAKGRGNRSLKQVRLISRTSRLLFMQAYEKMGEGNMRMAAMAAAKRQAMICLIAHILMAIILLHQFYAPLL